MDFVYGVYSFIHDDVPSYYDMLGRVKWGLQYCHSHCNESASYSPADFFTALQKYTEFDLQYDTSCIIVFAVMWTFLRFILSHLLFKPIARWFRLMPVNAEKFPESIWKFLVYTSTWSSTCYVIFGLPNYRHVFFDPDSIWDDYLPGMRVEPLVYYLYMLQLSFYVHSILASFTMDVWRKDSVIMVFHHFLTISLIGFSYAARYHKIGLLVLFCHDITDIILEFTKCNVYFKTRGGNFYRTNEVLSNVGFLLFALAWMLFRLYWLPLKVLHSTGFGSMKSYGDKHILPFYMFFNFMLWTLQLLNIYWFLFIIYFIIKVATGQIDEVDDIREDDVGNTYQHTNGKRGTSNKKKN